MTQFTGEPSSLSKTDLVKNLANLIGEGLSINFAAFVENLWTLLPCPLYPNLYVFGAKVLRRHVPYERLWELTYD